MFSSVLIIDDSPGSRTHIAETLRKAHLFEQYREACDGLEGFKMLLEDKPELIICDLEMPRMDGLKFVELVNSRQELKDTPIIIVTGKTDFDLKVKGLDQGAFDFINKPFNPAELVSRVKVQLKIKSLQNELRSSNELLKALSDTDALTRLYNRRFLMEDLAKEMDRAKRKAEVLSLIMLDIDHFKMVNDNFGHLNGDLVLMAIAEVCQSGLRCYDIAARYGGEEFVLLLPETSLEGAVVVATRLREAVQSMVFPAPMEHLVVTVSLGVATFPLAGSAESLLRHADEALYRAKRNGRNRVEAMSLLSPEGAVSLEGPSWDKPEETSAPGRGALNRAHPGMAGEKFDSDERKKTEKELVKANRALKTLSACNKALVYAFDERSLLIEICDTIVKNGGYVFAWVGYAMDDEQKDVRPVAYAGNEHGYLDAIKVTWSDMDTGSGPCGSAIKSGTPCIVGDTRTDINFTPWRLEASRRGFASVIALPLIINGQIIGCLNIYAAEAGSFDQEEVMLLHELTSNLAYGISTLRMREEQKKGEQEKAVLENQLRHSQKMEAVGTLAGGIAHDFNNILTTIVAYCALIQRKTGDGSPVQEYLEKLRASADRAAKLTNGLLAYSRKQPLNPQPIELNALISKVTNLLSRLLGEDIELTVLSAEQQLIVLADSLQVEQVLMNLATNARDAMPQGGILQIATKTQELDADFIKTHGYGEAGSYAVVTVTDSGSGMDAQTRERIFEPFFTTKGIEKGTGLGLSIAYGIIKQHNGYINVYSEPDKGTTFTLYFPLTDHTEAKTERKVQACAITGSETILLVEDDAEIRATLQEILEGEGYTIIAAADGEDGLRKFKEHGEDIQLLILDVVMPKKNGREMYDEVIMKRPGTKVLFISGYASDFLHTKGILHADENFLAKPIVVNNLLVKIREVLEQ